ncbi:acyltransferase [Amycolatopsis antarctica]|uniref:Acyltransferase n=1 Tax=Amycolatopsis antarctica TaxID=1854586 RepID=A0A263D2J3_9PSEU|nr:TIGR03618 family F420-dependent PPOX class oxidoreductase [Amycolatopsis antarctica]OZM72429.1 acyltransferase [Amycolatopsis antarctica]
MPAEPASTRPPSSELLAFWRERHLCTLTTLRPSGTPHVVPVGVTVSDDLGQAWVICRRGGVKVRNILAADGGANVAVSQVDGRRWSTVEGRAVVLTDADSVRAAEDRYARRYHRQPAPNPERVVIRIDVTRRLGLS